MYKNVTRPMVYTFRLTTFVFPLNSYLVTLDGKYCSLIVSTSRMSVEKIM